MCNNDDMGRREVLRVLDSFSEPFYLHLFERRGKHTVRACTRRFSTIEEFKFYNNK